MANPNDSAILHQINYVQHYPDLLISVLERRLPEMIDDSTYWHALLMCWVQNGQPQYQERYRALMNSPRRNRIRAMKRGHIRVWRALPDPVIAYHGLEDDQEDADRALAWTIDPAVARKFAGDRPVLCRAFPKRLVPFFTDRRGEREVIVLDASQGQDLPPDTPPCITLERALSRNPERRLRRNGVIAP